MDSSFERALKGELPGRISPEVLASVVLGSPERRDPGTFDADWRALIARLYADIGAGLLVPASIETKDALNSAIWAFLSQASTPCNTHQEMRYLLDIEGAFAYFINTNDALANSVGFRAWVDDVRRPEYVETLTKCAQAKKNLGELFGNIVDGDSNSLTPSRSNRDCEFTKSQILAVEWILPTGAPHMKNILEDVPAWISQARVQKGKPGEKFGAIWNIVSIAKALAMDSGKKKWRVPKHQLTRIIAASFPSALSDWEDWVESYG